MLRVASSFTLTLAPGTKMTCADAVKKLLKGKHGWEVRSAGKRSKSDRWYTYTYIHTTSPPHNLLIHPHLKTNKLTFHYYYIP